MEVSLELKFKINSLSVLILAFSCLHNSVVSNAVQHSVRGEHQLSLDQVDQGGGQNSKLESHKCPDLLQLLAAGVLLRDDHDEDASKRQESEDHPKDPPNPN